MKIGLDITPVIYQGTGIGTYTRELVRHLLPIGKKHHFTLFASTCRGQNKVWQFLKTLAVFKNFSVKIYPFPPLVSEIIWNKFHWLPLEKLIGEIDVFHAWDWQQPPAQKAKLVTTIHDLTILKFPQEHHPKTIKVHRRRLNWVEQEAAAIIADSQATKKDIINLLGVDKRKIHPIYLAASEQFAEFKNQDSPFKSQEITRIRKKYNLQADYLLSVGTREPRKNLARVVESFAQLQDPKLSLAIVGKYGWGKPADRQSTSNVKILGLVEQQDLPALYVGAKAFVYPSLYEGFGLPVLEAMSVGCPVVTSNRGSLKEVAGTAAVIVNPQDSKAIATGLQTAIKESKQLIKRGFKQARKFSWQQTARKTLKVYQSVK